MIVVVCLTAVALAPGRSTSAGEPPVVVAISVLNYPTGPGTVAVRGFGGQAKTVVLTRKGFQPIVSHDGRSVAYMDDEEPEREIGALVIATWDGARIVRRTVLADLADTGSFSADDRRLAVAQWTGSPSWGGPVRIVVIDLATDTTHVAASVPNGIEGFSISPAGDRVVFAQQRRAGDGGYLHDDLFVVPAEGGPATRLTRDQRSMRPLWGRKGIAFERLARESSRRGHPSMNLIQPDGTGTRRLAVGAHHIPIDGLWPIAWSQSGTRLVFDDDGYRSDEGWGVDLRTGRARDLTGRQDDVSVDGISADGHAVLLEGGRAGLSTIPFAGGTATRLPLRGEMAAWSWTDGP